MWIPARWQHLGQIDISRLASEILDQPQALWDCDDHLKHKIAGNRQTQSLFLEAITTQEFIDIIKQRKLSQTDVTRYSAFDVLHKVVQPIVDYALSHYPSGGVVLCVQLARMMPGAKIDAHTDHSPLLRSSYRLHVPIVTNEDVDFFVDGELIKMQEGNLYCLNNRVPHWVENRSEHARTHLIIDYLPPENNGSFVLKENFDLRLKEQSWKSQIRKLPELSAEVILPKVITTSVIRGAKQNESHGGVYLLDMQNGKSEQVVDWNTIDIDFSGRGWDRGLRGIAFHNTDIYIAASNELFCFDKQFNIRNSYRNPYLQHAHEIVIEGSNLYITSTGFDSVLRFDLKTKKFDKGWLVRISRNGRMEIGEYIPEEPYGPEPGNSTHINNVYYDSKRLYVSGRNLNSLFRLSELGITPVCELPRGTHNAQKYKDGFLFNDTESDRLVHVSTYDYFALSVPVYPQENLLNNELGDEKIARQAFGRGLCLYGNDIVIAGSSPSTISAYDLHSQRLIKSINLSMDIRNAIHGLEIWPF